MPQLWPDLDYDFLASRYFGDQAHSRGLRNIASMAARYRDGLETAGPVRQRELQTVLKHATALAREIGRIGGPTLASILTPPPGGEDGDTLDGFAALPDTISVDLGLPGVRVGPIRRSGLPAAIGEMGELERLLNGILPGLQMAIESRRLPRQRPRTLDPIVAAAEGLVRLWQDACGEEPAYSLKDGGIVALGIEILGRSGVGFPEEKICTALRGAIQGSDPHAIRG